MSSYEIIMAVLQTALVVIAAINLGQNTTKK